MALTSSRRWPLNLLDRTFVTNTASAASLLAISILATFPAVAQEVAAEEEAKSEVTTTEAQAFLGYWMLTAKLGERDLRMGLNLYSDRETGDANRVAGSLVSAFGEMTADNFSRDGKSLAFDLASGIGNFEVSVAVDDNTIAGNFADVSGQLSADFTGVKSDRVAFQRFMVPGNETRLTFGEDMVRLRFAQPKAEGQDFEQLGQLADGEVVQMREFGVHKLITDYPLKFGALEVPNDNVTANYPGVYGLWLEKAGSGWNLVLNHKPDVWATQYDPSANLGKVALEHSKADEPSERMKAEFSQPAGEASPEAILTLTWGEHRWSVPFSVELPEPPAP